MLSPMAVIVFNSPVKPLHLTDNVQVLFNTTYHKRTVIPTDRRFSNSYKLYRMSEQPCLAGMPSEILLLIFSHLLHLNAPLTFKPTHCERPTNFIAIAQVSKRFYDLTSKVFYGESCFTIDVTPQKLGQLDQSSYHLNYLESDMFKVLHRQMKHFEIISGEWLLFERFPGLIGNHRLFADAIASYVSVLMYCLHHSAPQLEKITFATRVPDRYGARITQDLTLDAVSSVLPNVKEISIVRRIDPLEEIGVEGPIRRTPFLTFRKKVTGDWENLFGPDPRRLRQLEEQNIDNCSALAVESPM